MTDRFTSTHESDQDDVHGFAISCGQAMAIQRVLNANARILQAMGQDYQAGAVAGYGLGLVQGSCPY